MAKEAKEQCSIIFDGSGQWVCVKTAQDLRNDQWKPSSDVPGSSILFGISKKCLANLAERGGLASNPKDRVKNLVSNLKEKWQDVCSGAGSSGGGSGAGSSGGGSYDKLTKVQLLHECSKRGIMKDTQGRKITIKTSNALMILALEEQQEDGSNQDEEEEEEEDGSNQHEEDGSNQDEEDGSNQHEEDGEKDA